MRLRLLRLLGLLLLVRRLKSSALLLLLLHATGAHVSIERGDQLRVRLNVGHNLCGLHIGKLLSRLLVEEAIARIAHVAVGQIYLGREHPSVVGEALGSSRHAHSVLAERADGVHGAEAAGHTRLLLLAQAGHLGQGLLLQQLLLVLEIEVLLDLLLHLELRLLLY